MLPITLNPETGTHGKPHTGWVATLAPGCEAGEGVPIPPVPPPFIQPKHRCTAEQTICDKAAGEALNTLIPKHRAEADVEPVADVAPVADAAGGARTYTRIRAEGTCTRGRRPGSIRASREGLPFYYGDAETAAGWPDTGKCRNREGLE
jgi:hypothetical protein